MRVIGSACCHTQYPFHVPATGVRQTWNRHEEAGGAAARLVPGGSVAMAAVIEKQAGGVRSLVTLPSINQAARSSCRVTASTTIQEPESVPDHNSARPWFF